METQPTQPQATSSDVAEKIILPTAALLTLLSASCCVLPIGLSIIGLGGSWLTLLAPLVVYRSTILVVIGCALVWAWYRVIWPKDCGCPKRSAIVWTSISTSAFLIAASSPLWEATASKFMWGLFRATL